MLFGLFAIIGYLMGSLSSAIVVCRLMGLPDPRTQGSKNPGATNVMRIGGKKAAYLTFTGDFLKGLIPVILACMLSDELAIAGAGIGAFLGHLYPLYFGFKGGKGVATLAGVILGVSWPIFLIVAIVWAAIVFVTGYVSLASMVTSIVTVLLSLIFGLPATIVVFFAALSVLVIYKHRENIMRLKSGTESKFKKNKNND